MALSVSAGSGLILKLQRNLTTADASIPFTASAYDLQFVEAAAPPLAYVITAAKLPSFGSLPVIVGNSIVPGPDTRGGTLSTEIDEDQDAAPAPLRFERRSEDRWPLTGVAEAHRLGGDRFGQVAVLRLVDCSEECLGATCDEPLEPGAVVSLAFRTPGRPVRNGVVVRCLPCGEGYRVAVRFDRRLAA